MTKEQENELMRVAQYYPYRIVWAKIDKDTKAFEVFANPTKHRMNKAVREGHMVWTLK